MPDAPSWALRRQLRGEERRENYSGSSSIEAVYTKTTLHGKYAVYFESWGNIERVRAKKKCL